MGRGGGPLSQEGGQQGHSLAPSGCLWTTTAWVCDRPGVRASLVDQWLGLRLPVWEVWVRSLVGELRSRTSRGQKIRSNKVSNSTKTFKMAHTKKKNLWEKKAKSEGLESLILSLGDWVPWSYCGVREGEPVWLGGGGGGGLGGGGGGWQGSAGHVWPQPPEGPRLLSKELRGSGEGFVTSLHPVSQSHDSQRATV